MLRRLDIRLDLIELFKMFETLSRVTVDEMFTMDENKKSTRGRRIKLWKTKCTRDITRLCQTAY